MALAKVLFCILLKNAKERMRSDPRTSGLTVLHSATAPLDISKHSLKNIFKAAVAASSNQDPTKKRPQQRKPLRPANVVER